MGHHRRASRGQLFSRLRAKLTRTTPTEPTVVVDPEVVVPMPLPPAGIEFHYPDGTSTPVRIANGMTILADEVTVNVRLRDQWRWSA